MSATPRRTRMTGWCGSSSVTCRSLYVEPARPTVAPISVETLRCALESVTPAVEGTVATGEMPDRLASSSTGGRALCSGICLIRGERRFLLSGMLLRDFTKRLDQYAFLVGNNFSVNRRLATLMSIPLVGYASHRLNQAVTA